MLSILKKQYRKYYDVTLPKDWKTAEFDHLPEQPNGHDCGPFICEFGDFVTRRINIDFDPYNGPEIRERIAKEIKMEKLKQTPFFILIFFCTEVIFQLKFVLKPMKLFKSEKNHFLKGGI